MQRNTATQWDQAISVLADNYFHTCETQTECQKTAEQYLKDSVHFLTRHIGLTEEFARQSVADGFSSEDKILPTMLWLKGTFAPA